MPTPHLAYSKYTASSSPYGAFWMLRINLLLPAFRYYNEQDYNDTN